MWVYIIIALAVAVLVSSIKVIMQYQEGVKFTLGKYAGIIKPGLRIVIPIIQTYQKIDRRIDTIDIADQDAMTKDNVSLRINAVLYYRVIHPKDAVINVEDFDYAISQLAQTTMRNVVGEVILDELLSKRDMISHKIQTIVDKAAEGWGLDILSVDLKHIELPDQMKRSMAQEAEAERERRAVITRSEGEAAASENMKKAAKILSSTHGALHLRTLQNLSDVASDPSNTVSFFVPVEGIDAYGSGKSK